MSFKRKKKNKDNLILEGEEQEYALKSPFAEYRKKKKYKVKSSLKTTKAEESSSSKDLKKKSESIEDEVTILPGYYEEIPLGILKRGTIISFECSELEGNNFTYLIIDKTNYQKFRRENRAPKPFMSGKDWDEFKHKKSIRIEGEYFLIFTSRAQNHSRTVWYHLEIQNS